MRKNVAKQTTKPQVEITILTHDARWKGLAPTVKRAAEAALAQQKVKQSAVTIVLVEDAEVQALNRDYRGKNKPTNVLSFPNGEVEEGVRQLGDIILSYDTLAAEAAAQCKLLKHHLTHLTIHGVLHLLGYDHEAEAEANRMEAIEIMLLARMGIANPYESE
jgi:probable rRNA maturation factor